MGIEVQARSLKLKCIKLLDENEQSKKVLLPSGSEEERGELQQVQEQVSVLRKEENDKQGPKKSGGLGEK